MPELPASSSPFAAILDPPTTSPFAAILDQAAPEPKQSVSQIAAGHLRQMQMESELVQPEETGLAEPTGLLERGKYNPVRYLNLGEQLYEQSPVGQALAKPLPHAQEVIQGALSGAVSGAPPGIAPPVPVSAPVAGLSAAAAGLTAPENLAILGLMGFSPQLVAKIATPAFMAQMGTGVASKIDSGVARYSAGDKYGGMSDVFEGLGSAGIMTAASVMHEGPMREKAGMPAVEQPDTGAAEAPKIPPVPLAGISDDVHTMPNGDIVRALNPPDPELRQAVADTFPLVPKDAADAEAVIEAQLKPLYDSDANIKVKTEDTPVASTNQTGKNSYTITLPTGYEPYQLLHEFGEVLAKDGDMTLESVHDNNAIAANHLAKVAEPALSGEPLIPSPAISDDPKIAPGLEEFFDHVQTYETLKAQDAALEAQERAAMMERPTDEEAAAGKAEYYGNMTRSGLESQKYKFQTQAQKDAELQRGLVGWRAKTLKERGGETFGMLGAPEMEKYGTNFIQQDIKPIWEKAVAAANEFSSKMADIMAPWHGTTEGLRNVMAAGRGMVYRAKDAMQFNSQQASWLKALGRLDHEGRLNLMEQYANGIVPDDPALANYGAFRQKMFDNVYNARKAAGEPMEEGAYKSGYVPRIWQQLPLTMQDMFARGGPQKASLLGSGNWLEHQVLDNARQGEALGGKLLTDNIYASDLMALRQQWKSVAGRVMGDYVKSNGLAVPTNLGEELTDTRAQPHQAGCRSRIPPSRAHG